MRIKTVLFGLLSIVFVFQSMSWLGLLSGKVPLRSSDYKLVTHNVSADNPGAIIRDDGKGLFYVHTGERTSPMLTLKFKRSLDAILDLRIRNSGAQGEILYTTIHNGNVVSKDVVTNATPVRLRVSLARGDSLRVRADKHGSTVADHGELKVQIKDFSSKAQELVIPLLWSLLISLLIAKNYHFIALGSFLVFLLAVSAEELNYGRVGFNTLMAYTTLLYGWAFFAITLFQEISRMSGARLAAILISGMAFLLALVPTNFVVYLLSFSNTISQDLLFAVFQSNSGEAYEYVLDFYPTKFVIAGFVALLSIVLVFYLQSSKKPVMFERSVLAFFLMVFLLHTITQWSSLRIPVFVKAAFQNYHYELDTFKAALEQRKSQAIDFAATKAATGETYVIVMGESLSKKHMSLYGYPRNTNPLLSNAQRDGDLIRFNNAYSNHTHTTLVMQKSLTEANLYNGFDYVSSLSVLEVLNKAGFETHWLTNQVIYGPFDTITSVIASSADNLVPLNSSMGKTTKAQVFDEELVEELRKVLSTPTDKNRAIFIHLIGNHSIYSSRYPKPEYEKFKGKIEQGIVGEIAAKNEKVNSYDNSVLYNDFVVSSLLKELKRHDGISAFLYTADHAEDVISGLGHIAANFNFDMTTIPMLAWVSEGYRDAYPSKAKALRAHVDSLFSNDLLYDTLLGLAGVDSRHYSPVYNLTSQNYSLSPDEAKVLNSRKNFSDKTNTAYWQKRNAQHLIDSGQQKKIFPHRVNSLAKLREIWGDGFRSFEVDVRFGDDQTSTFRVGHHKGVMGLGLEGFLDSVDTKQIERIWLDVKNLNEKNYVQALERLALLHNKFDLKQKVLLESGTENDFFSKFRQAGWHTSYYIPTKRVVELIKSGDKTAVEALGRKMAKQTAVQEVNAVSFDTRIYPFVEKYLAPKLKSDIVFHVWYGPDLADPQFEELMEGHSMVQNSRVKTLLTKYVSQFHL